MQNLRKNNQLKIIFCNCPTNKSTCSNVWITKSWFVYRSCECVYIISREICGCAWAKEVKPIEKMPKIKMVNNKWCFNSKLSKYYYFKFFNLSQLTMGIISKAIILGGIFVLLFGVFSIILEWEIFNQ